MDELPTDGQTTPVPIMARATQWRLNVALVALVLAGFWLIPKLWQGGGDGGTAPVAKHDDGSFQATDQQWDTLRFAPVQTQPLSNSAQSDGRIAVDDDLTTPVFSAFTGQVTQIFARAGDRVTAGQPLFAVAANEAAQNDADLAATAAALRVAQANEARLKDLVEQTQDALTPDGLLVACHWRHPFEEACQDGTEVHRCIGQLLSLPLAYRYEDSDFLLEAWAGRPLSVAQQEGLR